MQQLGAGTLGFLRVGGADAELTSGQPILRKDEPGVAVHFIRSGAMAVAVCRRFDPEANRCL